MRGKTVLCWSFCFGRNNKILQRRFKKLVIASVISELMLQWPLSQSVNMWASAGIVCGTGYMILVDLTMLNWQLLYTYELFLNNLKRL